MLAHDLKNDLHAATLAAALLDMPDLPDTKRRAQIAIIRACLLRMKQRLADPSAGAPPPDAG
jgi:hypothetical protein